MSKIEDDLFADLILNAYAREYPGYYPSYYDIWDLYTALPSRVWAACEYKAYGKATI